LSIINTTTKLENRYIDILRFYILGFLKKLLFILPFLAHAAFAQVDSLTHAADTLKPAVFHELDSIEGSFNGQVDSLKQSYSQTKSRIDTLKISYQQKIDSLNKLGLSSAQYSHQVDSLNKQLAGVQQRATAKIDSLKGQVAAKVKSLNLPPEADKRITKLTSIDADIGDKIGLGNIKTAVPGPQAGGINAGVPSTNLPTANTGLPSVAAPDVGVQGNLDQLNQVTGKAGEVQQQIKEGVSVEKVEGAVEDRVAQLDQVKAIQGQALPGQPEMPIEMPDNGDAAKEQLMSMAKKEAVNHFAGKEAMLQEAMDKMSKYKEKYNSVSSIKDLPPKRPNPMKEKPFVERLVPGLTLQFHSNQNFLLDVNGSLGFKFTERIIAGLGWNQRWAYSIDSKEFSPSGRIYGVRSYGEFHFKKGFALRADVECMNTLVKETLTGISETGYREWVWSMFTGVKQEYRITSFLKGNAQVMYNLFDPHNKSPYGDRLNVRIGFELVIKKKPKTK
jgi:hypothetical protein